MSNLPPLSPAERAWVHGALTRVSPDDSRLADRVAIELEGDKVARAVARLDETFSRELTSLRWQMIFVMVVGLALQAAVMGVGSEFKWGNKSFSTTPAPAALPIAPYKGKAKPGPKGDFEFGPPL